MMQESELAKALELQQKAYQLILWLGSLADGAKLSFDQVHEAASMAEAGRRWVERNKATLPGRCRPESSDTEAFANLVSSFLSSSFDLVPEPGMRKDSRCGCYCSWCSCTVAASHLRTKKTSKKERDRARDLQVDFVIGRALKMERSLSRQQALGLIENDELGEATAIATYAVELVRRMKGLYEGPAVLALWRRFAWNKKGSPKKDFKLTVQAVQNAEALIERAIKKRRNEPQSAAH